MNIRIAPQAICREFLANLEQYKPLTSREESRLLSAIEACSVPDAVRRLIANTSRTAVKGVLDKL